MASSTIIALKIRRGRGGQWCGRRPHSDTDRLSDLDDPLCLIDHGAWHEWGRL